MLKKLTSRLIGNKHEKAAERFLVQQGLCLVARNMHCRFGEIDLIMLDGETLVFIEVRFRQQNDFGSAIESVNRNKQQKILRTAGYFLTQNPQFQHSTCRFDIVGISQNGSQIDWLKSAFME